MCVNGMIPSSKTIVAIYIVPKVVNNEHIQAIPTKALELFEAKLDIWLDQVGLKK